MESDIVEPLFTSRDQHDIESVARELVNERLPDTASAPSHDCNTQQHSREQSTQVRPTQKSTCDSQENRQAAC